MVSLDIFRVGAVEPRRRHAEPVGFPGRGVGEPCATPAGCVHGLRDMPSDVLLALPQWLGATDAECVLASYASAKITGVVITQLGETDQVGDVMHALIGGELPVTSPCDGARVPEVIHDAAAPKVLDAIFPEQA